MKVQNYLNDLIFSLNEGQMVYKRVFTHVYGVYQKRIYMCIKNAYMHPSKRHIYAFKVFSKKYTLLLELEPIIYHEPMHFETNGQLYDITGKYLYVKFPRMKTLRCKTFKNIC